MPMDLLCRLQSENRRLKEERDALAGAIGEAVVKMGVAQAVPMTGPELIHMLQFAAEITPCTFPDCMSARAMRAAGEEVEKLRVEVEQYKEALQVATKRLQMYRHADTVDHIERIVGRCGVCGGNKWRGMRDNKRGVIAYACECGHSWERTLGDGE